MGGPKCRSLLIKLWRCWGHRACCETHGETALWWPTLLTQTLDTIGLSTRTSNFIMKRFSKDTLGFHLQFHASLKKPRCYQEHRPVGGTSELILLCATLQ